MKRAMILAALASVAPVVTAAGSLVPQPQPQVVASLARAVPRQAPARLSQAAEVSYPNCAAVRAAGVAPLREGEPGYSPRLDRDGDGLACE